MFPDGAELGQCIGAFCVMDPRTSLTIHPHMEMIASRPRRHLIDQLILFTALDPLVIGGWQKIDWWILRAGNNGVEGGSRPHGGEAGGFFISFSLFFFVVFSCSHPLRHRFSGDNSPPF